MFAPLAAGAGDPPPIPAARLESLTQPRRPLLIWVRAGTAHVHVDGAAVCRLGAGHGAWVPADGWERRTVVTEPGTVAFPLAPHDSVGAGAPPGPTPFPVPDGWHDWLIQQFNLQITPLSGPGYSHDAIADLLRCGGTSRSASRPAGAAAPVEPPAMPVAAGARSVAEELIRDPALGLTVEQWAARAFSSARTLRRDFLADTGLTFEQWRLRCRLSAAVELLASGYDIDRTVARVGFATRNGFDRAFRQHVGTTPHEFCRMIADSGAGGPSQRAAAARQADELARMVHTADARAAPAMLPATSTPSHANDVHVLSWIYRGSGYLDIGEHRYERERGVATWIPAGVEHVTGLRENSVSLPLGNATRADLQLGEPLQVRFSPAWDDYLMFCSVSGRSGLRPAGHDRRHVLDLFAEQVAAQRALSVPMPADPSAHAVALDYLRRLGGGEATAPDVSPEVHRAFREQTGMTFLRWRYAARMRVARDLLAGGAKASAVARRVGYRHLPTFSAAFTRFHGASPREYQEREAERR